MGAPDGLPAVEPGGAGAGAADRRPRAGDSAAIFEYLEETTPDPPLLPKSPALRAEARRLAAWFDDKFHDEVTANLLYERVNKKLAKSGYPESEKIKAGVRNIKYHLDYVGWLMETGAGSPGTC